MYKGIRCKVYSFFLSKKSLSCLSEFDKNLHTPNAILERKKAVDVMSRMNQVMQIGIIGGDIHYYIEDYAYTYLKKQKGKEKTKYFLYGEKEESCNPQKLYIYGITEKPKMEQTYFKDYYPLGFLKIKNDENYWITLKGQEQKMTGFYVFYAPNQAMQEYLVDHREEEKIQETGNNAKRQLSGETLPMKETFVPARKMKSGTSKEFKNEKFLFPIGGIMVACLLLVVLTSANGKKKIEIFKQVIAQNVVGMVTDDVKDELIIEEKNINDQGKYENVFSKEETVKEDEKAGNEYKEQVEMKPEENILEEEKSKEKVVQEQETSANSGEEIAKDPPVQSQSIEKVYEEYVVKNGDTLVAICKSKYGSLSKMQEICTINNIKNADYIAPGQKLYLP